MSEELKSNAMEDLPNRKNLVDTAVGFLLNPNVKQRPDDAKITFLKNKGLTDSEITEAFNRAKYEAATATVSDENNQLVNAYPLPPHHSFWFYLRSYSSAFVSFAVAVYVLHRFYKSYIEPWLFGAKSEPSEISALKQELVELNNSVSRLNSTVASLEEAVNNQMHQIDRTSIYGVESVPKSVRDIQEEVSNVKSLLLNRFSFPAPPALAGTSVENKIQNGESKPAAKTVTIPKWQLRDSEHSKSKEHLDAGGDKKSSAELLPLENNLSSTEDQAQDDENNSKIAKGKIPNDDSRTLPENNVEASENTIKNTQEYLENLGVNSKIQEGDSTTVIGNIDVKKTLDEDSGIESHDPESTDKANNRSLSEKDSE